MPKNSNFKSKVKNVVKTTAKEMGKQIGSKVLNNLGKDLVKVAGKIVNHPEWYTNYKAAGLVNLNFGIRKDIPLYGAEYVTAVCAIPLRLTIPASRLSSKQDMTIDNGWEQGIQRLYSSLRGANTSSSPYSIDDLRGYVQNVRILHAAYATLRSLYAAAWNYDPYDGRMPAILIKALGFDPDDVKENLANIRMYGAQLGMKIAASFPMHLPIVDRTRWLFSNVFADSNDAKASLYVFRFSTTSGDATRNRYQTVYLKETEESPYSNLTFPGNMTGFIASINRILDAVDNNNSANIAAEMLRAFGESAVYKAEVWPESMAIPIVHDEAALTQIQNMSVIAPQDYTTQGKNGLSLITAAVGSGTRPSGVSEVRRIEIANITEAEATVLIDMLQSQYINFYKNGATPGECLSAMRLRSTWETMKDGQYIVSNPLTVGTELPFDLLYYDHSNSDPDQTALIAYRRIPTTVPGQVQELCSDISDWSEVDYGPRLLKMVTFYDANGDIWTGEIADCWDWNNYAAQPVIKSQISFNSIANMSLLYVPALVRLANWQSVNLE